MNKVKQHFFKVFLLISCSFYCGVINAYDFEIDGLYFNILSDNQVEITSHTKYREYAGKLEIPERVNYNGKEFVVVSIGKSAFSECKGLTGTITIPNSVTTIGANAFFECIGLTGSLTIPNSVINLGDYAFAYCEGFNGTLTISNSVTSIGNGVFCKCKGFTGSLTIPDKVTSIGNSAFDECKCLNGSIIIPNSVVSIGAYAFRECEGFDGTLTLPNSLITIGSFAFASCHNLIGALIIPNSVTSIGEYAFANCESFNDNLKISEKVNSIEDFTFYCCEGLIGSLIIPNSVTKIGEYAFGGCDGFNSILTISDKVTFIGKGAFSGCKGLTGSLTIPNSVNTIGNWAFSRCSGFIGALTIPSSVKSIGERTFSECKGLTGPLTIPYSVTSIKERAFAYCSNIKNVVSEIQYPFEIREDVFLGIASSAKLIVPQGTKNAYFTYPGWTKNFKEVVESGSISVGQINYSIESETNKSFHVANGDYGLLLEVPSMVTYMDEEWTVTGIDNEVLSNNPDLAAIIWHPEAEFTEQVSNPNLLLYVNQSQYAPSGIRNVIVNGIADSITLTDAVAGNNFYCPKEFIAKEISYTHNYSMETGLGNARGWETIALPFDVQKVTHQSKGEIVPFANWKSGDAKKPFWLMTYGNSGWTEANSIKANTPYIISMPNHSYYKSEFQLNGNVTFIAENVTIPTTENINTINYNGRTFVPNYKNQSDNSYYTLNVNNDYETYSGSDVEGSKFFIGLRAVHPFEAYMTSASQTRSYIAIDDDMTTGIGDITEILIDEKTVRVYNLNGQLIMSEENKSIDEIQSLLSAGVYIVNGKKLVIK